MVKVELKDYKEGDFAVRTVKVTLFGIALYEKRECSANNNVLALYKENKTTTIKGYNNEN